MSSLPSHREPFTFTAATCAHCGLPVPPARQKVDPSQPSFCCLGCRFAFSIAAPATNDPDASPSADRSALLLRLGLSIFLAMNIMTFNWLFLSREVYGERAGDLSHTGLAGVFAYLQMFMAAGVVALLGLPLASDAIGQLFNSGNARWHRRLDANLLICIGVAAAIVLSIVSTVQSHGRLYFDTATMILVLVAVGQQLDAAAKKRAMLAARGTLEEVPRTAEVMRDGEWISVQVDSLVVGDQVRVAAGGIVPVDGCVVKGRSHVTSAALTGESLPRAVEVGDAVLASSHVLDGMLVIATAHAGDDRLIRRLHTLLEMARLDQPPIQRLADRVAVVFVPCVLVLAVMVFAFHAWSGQFARGTFDALCVLLISCPCALGLAAPLATWSALSRAARRGIVINSAAIIERAAGLEHVFFDKTGTLTQPRLTLRDIHVAAEFDVESAICIAASLEAASTHPIAACLRDAAKAREIAPQEVTESQVVAGRGVSGVVDGVRYRLGSPQFAQPEGTPTNDLSHGTPPLSAADSSMHIVLANPRTVVARFAIGERVRDESAEAIGRLAAMGISASMLSGDQSGAADRIGAEMGITAESRLMPDDKLRRLEATRGQGKHVAMVGDGMNDAPTLAAADVGFAMGGGTDLAQQAGHVRLLHDRLTDVPDTIALSRHCMRRIRWNLAWAFGYNIVGLTLAVVGLLNPIFAASTMIVSSLVIIAVSRGAGGNLAEPARSSVDVMRRDAIALPSSQQSPSQTSSPQSSSLGMGRAT